MTEADITFQLSELFDRWWAIHQWWVSVSFGLIAVAYFAADKLNYLLVGVILVLYVSFSVWLYGLVGYTERVVDGFLLDLGNLIEAGQIQSEGAKEYLNAFQVSYWSTFAPIAKIGTFISVVIYVAAAAFERRD